jgi:hypothetical protein
MAPHQGLRTASTIAMAIALTACGGGGGGSGLVLTPPPVPAPPPPPPPPPSIGLTQQRDFATIGIADSFTTGSNGTVQGNLVPDLTGTVEFRYLASEQAYEVVLPGLAPGRLETTNSSGNFSGNIVRDGNRPGTQQAALDLFRPGSQNTMLALTYTSFGIWGSGHPNDPGPHTGGFFAYGVPTAAGDVPAAGTGTYTALVEGIAMDGGVGIGGHAQLVFDFGAGTLTGHMQPSYDTWEESFDLGRYDFTQTVYSTGGRNFSGRFAVPGSTADSFFEGQFTGPQAAELMARWQAPFKNPYTQQWSTMLGIWVGKKN